ncbi:MAG: DUF4245 domain-containing protein [Frankiaceae bacterium]|nr:DUF4245 domain-containing protein [Frankiaceae bacterium]MBV9872942.1 DUF4245 domain-containing protein [Frankiaceae bacterium]
MTSTEPPRSEPTQIEKPRRGSETGLDMVRSIGLIIVVTAVTLIFVPGLLHPSKSDRMPPVDYSSYVAGFHQVTGKAALVPTPAPASWRANAGTLTGPASTERLHVGFVVPGAEYAGLDESVGPMATIVKRVLGKQGLAVTGSTQIEGRTWQSRESSRGELAITRRAAGVNIVITGSARGEDLELLAASLRPAS